MMFNPFEAEGIFRHIQQKSEDNDNHKTLKEFKWCRNQLLVKLTSHADCLLKFSVTAVHNILRTMRFEAML